MTKYMLTTLEDLVKDAEVKSYVKPENQHTAFKVIITTFLFPLLTAVFGIIVLGCFLVWWDIYGYYALRGALGALSLFVEWLQYGR